MKTLGLKEAATLLLLASLRQMASAGKVPGARVGKWKALKKEEK